MIQSLVTRRRERDGLDGKKKGSTNKRFWFQDSQGKTYGFKMLKVGENMRYHGSSCTLNI